MKAQDKSGVVQVSPYYSVVRGGVATMVRTLVQQLAGHSSLSVVVTGEQGGESDDLASEVYVANETLRVPFRGDGRVKAALGWMVYLIPTMISLRSKYRRTRAGIAHLHFASPEGHYFRLLRFWTACPYIVTLHGSDVMRYHERAWFARFLIRYTLKGSCRVVAVSNALASSAVDQFPFLYDRIAVIHNGIDAGAIREVLARPDESNRSRSRPYFIAVGGLLPVKGFDVAIHAWRILKDRAPELDLLIVGDGELRTTYMQMIADLGLQEQVHLIGALSANEVWRAMAGASGVVVPSRSEGLPYVILEAGAVGIPVAATRVGGIPELIHSEQDGLLVPSEDPQELANAVMRLYTDRGFAASLARSLNDRVLKSHSAQAMAEQYRSIYRQCGWRAAETPAGGASPTDTGT